MGGKQAAADICVLCNRYFCVYLSACVFSFSRVYQYGGYTQGFVSQRVSDVRCLAFVSLCHIESTGRIPSSNLLKQASVKSISPVVQQIKHFKVSRPIFCFLGLKLRSRRATALIIAHLFQPFFLQTNDIQVEICSQSIALVE